MYIAHLKKLAININSRMDVVAERFENREALSSAYIREYERIVAKAKVRLAQVDNEVARLKNNSRELGEKIQLLGCWGQVHAGVKSIFVLGSSPFLTFFEGNDTCPIGLPGSNIP